MYAITSYGSVVGVMTRLRGRWDASPLDPAVVGLLHEGKAIVSSVEEDGSVGSGAVKGRAYKHWRQHDPFCQIHYALVSMPSRSVDSRALSRHIYAH